MFFISLVKFKTRPTKAGRAETDKILAQQDREGIKTIGFYLTLGRYDAVRIYEAPDEKTAMKALMRAPESISIETLVAVKREDTAKWLD